MPLEQIVDAKEKFLKVDRVLDGLNPRSERVYENPAQAVYDLIDYGDGEATPAQVQFMLSRTPEQIGYQANAYHRREKQNLLTAVSGDYETAINNVPESDLAELALALPPTNDDTEARRKHLKYLALLSGDTNAFLGSIENAVIRDAVNLAIETEPEVINALLKATLRDFKTDFLNEFRNEEGNYQIGRLREYIDSNVGEYDEEQKDEAYVEIGRRVFSEDDED